MIDLSLKMVLLIIMPEHQIYYQFRNIRCRYICSCGSKSTHGSDTILGAERKAKLHLTKVGGDVNQPYRTKL